MAWVNFRTIQHRFGHIDAEFIGAHSSFSSAGNSVDITVRLYPWWEHPLYLSAIDRGTVWGFSDTEKGKREIKVRAIAPIVVHLSPRTEVIDWSFSENDPLLWSLGARASVFINGPVDRQALISSISCRLHGVSDSDVLGHVELPEILQAPFGMSVPVQLYQPTIDALGDLGVPVLTAATPAPASPAVVLVLDGDDYIIAKDFELDMPEFVHMDEWFNPGPA